jgi:transcription antitermination factor NusG
MGKKSNRRLRISPEIPRIVETLNPPPADLDLRKEAKWYLVYTAPRMEAKAIEGLEAAGCATFWPSIHRVITIRKRKPIELDVGIFPRYLFASGPLLSADPEAERVRFIVKGRPVRFFGDIDGVVDVIGSSRGGVRVPTSAIAEIARYQSKPVAPPKVRKILQPGEQMRVIEGPFASFQATVIEAIGMEEADVLIDIFGRMTRARMDVAQLDAA